MALLRCILLATAPALFWLWYFWSRDRRDREPPRLVLKLFALGAVAAGPAWLLEGRLALPSTLFLDNFVRVALVEEVWKLVPVWLVAYRRREFDEPMDGIVYAVAAALGFATVENVLYAMRSGPELLLYRAFTSTLAHVGFSGLVGYHIGVARTRPGGGLRVAGALFAVVALHGAYDVLLVHSHRPRWTIVVVVPVLLVLLAWAMRLASRAAPPLSGGGGRRATPPAGP